MNDPNKQKVSILRQRVPIGISHGLTLLERTHGDIDAAEILFKEEVLQIVINKTGVAQDVVLKHLISHNYDIPTTLRTMDEERFSLSELIYKRCKDKEDALTEVVFVLEEQYNIKDYSDGWVDLKAYSDLPEEIFSMWAIMRWLFYEEFEGFDVALSLKLDLVADRIENALKLTTLANSLRQARDIQALLYQKSETKAEFENYIKAVNELREIEVYQKCEDDYRNQRNLLIERLYDFVKVNIKKFP